MDRPRSAAARRSISYGIAALVFLLDRITKFAIQEQVTVWDTYTVIPGCFNIVHSENPGAAWLSYKDSVAAVVGGLHVESPTARRIGVTR